MPSRRRERDEGASVQQRSVASWSGEAQRAVSRCLLRAGNAPGDAPGDLEDDAESSVRMVR
jgi:hypothetical protein